MRLAGVRLLGEPHQFPLYFPQRRDGREFGKDFVHRIRDRQPHFFLHALMAPAEGLFGIQPDAVTAFKGSKNPMMPVKSFFR